MKFTRLVILVVTIFASSWAEAKVSVVTTITDLGAILKEVGGDEIKLDVICKGSQDPHHIEAKPSYMVIANRADLLVSIGLGLEVGWLPPILNGARNPKIDSGQKGFLEVGKLVDPIEVPQGTITRAEGDVHPEGNPHVTLDPIRAGKIAIKIAERLGELDSPNAKTYLDRATKLASRLEEKSKGWKKRIEASGVKKVVTYHKTLNYFFSRFGIENSERLEPKPGVPPSGPHILSVMALIKEQKVPLIMIENFFDDKAAKRIQGDIPTLRIATVPVAVDGTSEVKSLDELYEKLVTVIEGK